MGLSWRAENEPERVNQFVHRRIEAKWFLNSSVVYARVDRTPFVFKRGLCREIGFESHSDRGPWDAGREISSFRLRTICSGTVVPRLRFQQLPGDNCAGLEQNLQIE